MKEAVKLFAMAILAITTTCKKDNIVDPQIETVEVIATSTTTFTVTGNVIEPGSLKANDYGFVYDINEMVDINSAKVLMGSSPSKGTFQCDISPITNYGQELFYQVFVRAYITNAKGTTYGKLLRVIFPLATITSVSPMYGNVGDLVTIWGENFNSTLGGNGVGFRNQVAEEVEASSTKLVVKVPSGIDLTSYGNESASFHISMRVLTPVWNISSKELFTLLPKITSFSPHDGTFGTVITVTGSEIQGNPEFIYLKLGDIMLNAIHSDGKSFSFAVPSTVKSNSLDISMLGVPIGTFTMNQASITSFFPDQGIGTTRVTITGSNFNTAGNTVKIGGVAAGIVSASNTSIIAVVPTSLAPGTYSIVVDTGLHQVTAAGQFTVTP